MGKYIKKVYTRTCKLCGDNFESNRNNGNYCKKKHYKECLVCKSSFEIKVPNRPADCCSQRCVGLKSKKVIKTESKKEGKYKFNCKICKIDFHTNNKKKKYCENNHIFDCEICGDKFEAKSATEKYCKKQHYKPCEICGAEFKIKQNHRPGKVCSLKCGGILSDKTNKEKEVRGEKIYKFKKECLFCKKEFYTNRKSKIYCEVPHKSQCKYCKENFLISRFYEGRTEYSCGKKECQNKLTEETNLIKYGTKNVFQSEEIKNSIKRHFQKKYGVNSAPEIQIKNYNEWLDLKGFIEEKNLDCLQIARYFNVNVGTVRTKVKDMNLENKVKDFYKYSMPELNVKHILEKLGVKEKEIKPHYRKLINPKEVDFYIPKLKLAIEVSPTHTHSVNETHTKDKPVDKDYHNLKYNLCKERDVFLITVFEWYSNEEIELHIKSHIKRNILKKEKEVTIDLSLENPDLYKKMGYKEKRYCKPKLIYHNSKRNLTIKSNQTIKRHKDTLERNGFLPVYNCGYVILELA